MGLAERETRLLGILGVKCTPKKLSAEKIWTVSCDCFCNEKVCVKPDVEVNVKVNRLINDFYFFEGYITNV